MGILDKKTRFIDLVVTQEGRRQIAAGNLRAEFASFTDGSAFYNKGEQGSVSERIYFEVAERPENSIVLEKDDSGKLINFTGDPKMTVLGDKLFTSSAEQSETNLTELTSVTGSQFANVFAVLTGSSLNHFKKNYFIGTNDPNEQNDFELNVSEMTFQINNTQPFSGPPYKEIIHVDDAEPFFMDPKLTHLPNFQYLPPVNQDGTSYGNYTDIRSTSRETWEQIKERLGPQNFNSSFIENEALQYFQSEDNLVANFENEEAVYKSENLLQEGKLPYIQPPSKEVKEIQFLKTSTENNLLIQMYEDSLGSKFAKLDIIDAGIFEDPEDPTGRFEKRVFYVGKIYFDSFNLPTFINIFTLVMD